MKKVTLFLMTVGLIFSLGAKGQTSAWVQNSDERVNCKKVSVLGENVKVVLENGEKKTFPCSSVTSYFYDDKLYVNLPLQVKGEKKGCFMEFIMTRDDMSLYKYAGNGNFRYFVYKGTDLYVELLDGNLREFEKFFNVQL